MHHGIRSNGVGQKPQRAKTLHDVFFFKTNVCYDFRAEEGNHEVCGTIWFGLINQCVSPSASRPTFPELLVQDVEDLLVPAYKVFVARIKGGAIAISFKHTQIISHLFIR